jgi:glycosyltransferase involved in cell wall biosynthesis
MLKISVAICTYNREKYLPQLFASIEKQTLAFDRFEVVLVNNNSPGNTTELFQEFQRKNPTLQTRYCEEMNQGLSYSRNNAIHHANFELITFLDDDAFIDEDYLTVLVDEFSASPETMAIGGKILLHYEDTIPKWENRFLNSLLGYFNKGDEKLQFTSNDYPRGSNMAFRTPVFAEIGSFDVTLGRIGSDLSGGEEKDLFNKLYKHNMKVVYLPNALVYHSVPLERTLPSFIKKQGLGTGKSERIRSSNEGALSYIKRLFIELMKWGASLLIALYYLFTLHYQRAKMILLFRYWVTLGLLYK